MKPQSFWTSLFEEHDLSTKLAEMSSHGMEGQSIQSSVYGNVHLICKHATVLGDSFMSDTFSVHAKTDGGTTYDAFIKVIHLGCFFMGIGLSLLLIFFQILRSSIAFRGKVSSFKMHYREADMYDKYFQLLRELRCNSDSLTDQIPLDVPDLYFVSKAGKDEAETVLVIEDLMSSGYAMIDKTQGSDLKHANVALTSLAHFHALAIAFLRQHFEPESQKVVYPPGAEFLYTSSPFDLFPMDMVQPYIEATIQLMQALGREEVIFG